MKKVTHSETLTIPYDASKSKALIILFYFKQILYDTFSFA